MSQDRLLPAGALPVAIVVSLVLAFGLRWIAPEWHGGIVIVAAVLALGVVLAGAHLLGRSASDGEPDA